MSKMDRKRKLDIDGSGSDVRVKARYCEGIMDYSDWGALYRVDYTLYVHKNRIGKLYHCIASYITYLLA